MDVLRDEIEKDLQQLQVPGASWAVIDDGEIVQRGSAGVIEAGRPDAVTEDTLFQACSISKPVAVFAMLRLVDRGLLDPDEDVNRRLTSWRIPPSGEWQPIVTLRQLASHSAGLSVPGFPGYQRGAELPSVVQILDGVRPANTFGVHADLVPGTWFRYSGGGTVVLQQLLEDVTGTPFRSLLRELVLEPLGMMASDYAQPLPEELQARAATAHDEFGRPETGRWHSYPELAAAGLWTTPTDLAAFAHGVRDAYLGRQEALISPERAREMLTPQINIADPWDPMDAMGLGTFLADGGRRFGHGGSNKGFKCYLVAYRDTGQGAAVMTNGDNGGLLADRAIARIAAARGWEGYPYEVTERSEVSSDEVLRTAAGKYRLSGDLVMEVTASDGALDVIFGQQAVLRFAARGDGRFAARWVAAELRLVGSGELTFVQDGEELECVRLS
ncbi:serine hydrolase domain-containing protein [Kribbella sp. CA-293567]|uniref:serine hydrolase domain-containing protein n=1 Tax=Kribbella sp. CA-293567 TaxID=3002436 RepID=UPI0022DDD01A|nr:serine hydrolase domain-containing protein [Kribbella sp. CA-293567]WBQ08624.1 serine hydrolase [Kribbella sp. CA-293567]